jgi:hypothetical protein
MIKKNKSKLGPQYKHCRKYSKTEEDKYCHENMEKVNLTKLKR